MELNEYVGYCVATDDFPTRQFLTLSAPLVSAFRRLRGSSELDVRERGVHLLWNAHTGEVQPGTITMVGQGTAVDLKIQAIRTDFHYIGDCHTHPYRRKMGPEARIGPSTGDYMEWWLYPPAHFKIALHFVVSSATIFLVLTRAATERIGISTKGQTVDAVFGEVTSDTAALSAIQTKSMDDDEFNKEYLRATEKNDYKTQLELIERHFPGIAARFAEASLAMNVEMANKLRFEYYVGEMDEASAALQTCKLILKSDLVYGSAYAKAAVAFKRNPTLL